MPIRQRYKDDHTPYESGLQLDYCDSNGKRLRETIKPFPVANWIGLPCVYFLMEGNNCVYVGQTINLPCRLQTHLTDTEKKFDGIYYLEVSGDQLNVKEREIIRSLKPKLNKQG